MPVQSVDVCIVGGGMVGLAAAAFIHQRRPETTLEILDSQEIKAQDDGKSVVFSAASVSLLKSINAWPTANAAPSDILRFPFPARRRDFASATITVCWATAHHIMPSNPDY